MVNFDLEVAEIDEGSTSENYSILERYLRRKVSWLVLPRKGEEYGVAGNYFRVLQIYHDTEKGVIVVQVGASSFDFELTATETVWEKSGNGFET
jgi:hypothetical protein